MPDESAATIPEPEATGVEKVQRPPSPDETKALVTVHSSEGIGHLPISDTIKEIQEAGVRGQAGMSLLWAIITRVENDVKDLKEELGRVRDSEESWREKYHAAHTECEVLRAGLKTDSRLRHLQNGLLTLGGLVGGVAAPFIVQARSPLAVVGTLVGLALIVGGWWQLGEREKNR